MPATLPRSPRRRSVSPPAAAPVLRVLYVADRGRTGARLAEECSGGPPVRLLLDEVSGSHAGLARLRDETTDAVLIGHAPGELDGVDLAAAYRAGGADEPILILGVASDRDMAPRCYQAGADAYLCVHTATAATLAWAVLRAVERHRLVRDHRRLMAAERQRFERDHEEARRLLAGQRALLCHRLTPGAAGRAQARGAAGAQGGTGCVSTTSLPAELIAHYRELLRTYVIMGSGNLAGELGQLVEWLAVAGISAREALELHVGVLEELIRGLGSRSTRHVMNRADLLAIELLTHLAEQYHMRHRENSRAVVQKLLPGFEG